MPEGTRVLIIDDSPTIVAALRKILRSVKYEVLEAGDAETGIEIARTQKPELIFLDIVLPGMNGFAALRTMRRTRRRSSSPSSHDQRQRTGHRAVLRRTASAPTIS